jgi:hypothetical protein
MEHPQYYNTLKEAVNDMTPEQLVERVQELLYLVSDAYQGGQLHPNRIGIPDEYSLIPIMEFLRKEK